jgi:hypothetical protein
MAPRVKTKPFPPATVQVTPDLEITQVNGPDLTMVPGLRSGVPKPGFDPQFTPTHLLTTPDADRVAWWTSFVVADMQ